MSTITWSLFLSLRVSLATSCSARCRYWAVFLLTASRRSPSLSPANIHCIFFQYFLLCFTIHNFINTWKLNIHYWLTISLPHPISFIKHFTLHSDTVFNPTTSILVYFLMRQNSIHYLQFSALKLCLYLHTW